MMPSPSTLNTLSPVRQGWPWLGDFGHAGQQQQGLRIIGRVGLPLDIPGPFDGDAQTNAVGRIGEAQAQLLGLGVIAEKRGIRGQYL